MSGISVLQPEVLWLLPAAALLALACRLVRRRRFVAFTATAWLREADAWASPVRRLPSVLLALAFALVLAGLADPVVPLSHAQVKSQGLDIVLVLDLSNSIHEVMRAERAAGAPAWGPVGGTPAAAGVAAAAARTGRTRLEVTRRALRTFIAARHDDRIGLVVFSENAYIVSPLTFDHNSLMHYVNMIDDQILQGEGLTAIGDGIGLANYLLWRQSTDRRVGKVTLVFTDGVHNYGRDPISALADAAATEIRTHVIGIDLEANLRGTDTVRRLVSTVRSYGGQYYDAATADQLQAASAAIDKLERGKLTNTIAIRNAPAFAWFAIPALLLIVLALALRAIPYFADFT
ncbi:MAG: VWA domain-containing protein [Acidobacteria bacterium]|nr:VWA domain-containing protein [Acidobacteriota bacterium]